MSFRSIIFAALILAPISAIAQEAPAPNVGIANATSYTAIPEGANFDTVAAQDDGLNSTALQLVKDKLVELGHGTDPAAPLVMMVQTDLVRAIDQDVRADQPAAKRNVFSSDDNALLSRKPVPRSGHLLRLSLAVYDRQSGLYVWRGDIARDGVEVNVDRAMSRMVPALLAQLGKSAANMEVPLE